MSIRTALEGRMPVPGTRIPRSRLFVETGIVLLLSLGASAIYSALAMIRMLSAPVALNKQTSTLNASQASQSWLDLTYQLVGIALNLAPVALVLYLLSGQITNVRRYLGLDASRRVPDAVLGALLAACVGIPGLGLYLVARTAGLNTTVVASGLTNTWWTLPVLVLSAVQNALLEETVMIGYLYTRWSQAGWRVWQVMLISALIRGSYHLYQGFGGFVGNFVMGLIFGALYLRVRRVLPLVIAHSLLDIVAFVGYALLVAEWAWLR